MRARANLLTVATVLYVVVLTFGQSKDLSGIWVGETIVPGSADKDIVTLVLNEDGDSYVGSISDSLGMVIAAPLEKVKLANDTMTFEFLVPLSGQELRIRATLKVTGEKLVGSWEGDDGNSGPLDLARSK